MNSDAVVQVNATRFLRILETRDSGEKVAVVSGVQS
jgi:hypothetical protein